MVRLASMFSGTRILIREFLVIGMALAIQKKTL